LDWLPRIQIGEFSPEQIDLLEQNWFGDDLLGLSAFKAEIAQDDALKGLMAIPLLGTLIILVYRKRNELPGNKSELYRIFVELLCGRWDAAKHVWKAHKLGWLVKARILTRLARSLHWAGRRDCDETVVKDAIRATAEGLAASSSEVVADMLSDGLLEKSGKIYYFSHLSFQEYLAAKDLADPATSQADRTQVLREFLQGDDKWREVLGFYVAMTDNPYDMTNRLVFMVREAAPKRGADFDTRLDFLKDRVREAFPEHSFRRFQLPRT
jgi:predicted NACHT family NTPase